VEKLNRRDFIRTGMLAGVSLGIGLACSSPSATEAPKAAAPTSKPAESKPAEAKPAEAKPATANLRGSVPANPGAKGTVKFIHVWDGTRLPLMEKQIADFQALWPDVKIEAEVVSQQGMNEKYLTAIAGGSPPDAIMINHDQIPAFGGRGALSPLDELLQRDGMKTDDIFYETDRQLTIYKDKTLSLPQATSGGWYMMLWNKDLFSQGGLDPEKPPKTWEELEEVAKKLTKVEGGKASLLAMDLTWHPNYPMFKEWLYCNGGKMVSDDGKKILFAEAEGVQTLEWMLDFNERINGGFDVVRSLRAELGSTRDAWYNNRVVINIDGVWIFQQAKAANPNLNFGGGMLPYNAKNPQAKSVNVADTGWGYAIPKGAKNVDAAWEWVKYITAGEGNLNFFKGQTRPSPVRKYNEDPFFAQNNPHWPVVQEILKGSVTYPLNGAQAQINKLLNDMQEEALLKKKPAAQAVKDAAAQAQSLLDEWNSRQG
jgi:multiple sugar transport system substrate-binding protein